MVSVVYLACTPACEAGSKGSTPFGYPGKFKKGLVLTMNANVLEHPTLVLNRNWQPVNVATVALRAGDVVE